MTMKTNDEKRVLRFGDFIAAVYRVWGGRRATELVRMAVNAHWVVFRGQQRFLISEE
jgi:hypothetical protein